MDPAQYRPAPSSIPTEPGVYRFLDEHDRVLYVGKAINLRNRLHNYFADPSSLAPRTRQMVFAASQVRWTVVGTEVEALQLEYTWIQQYSPRYNVLYRDDKSYPMLAVTQREDFPRFFLYRGARRPGVRYFGPFSHAWAIRDTLDMLTRVFPVRTCTSGEFRRAERAGRPCLLGYIDKCSAPCVGRISRGDYAELVSGAASVLAGRSDRIVSSLTAEMKEASAELDFERAARLRDDLGALHRVLEKQAVVFGDGTDADVVGFASDDLEVAVQLFHVRSGRITGQRSWVVEKAGDLESGPLLEGAPDPALPDLVENFLAQFYSGEGSSRSVPRTILVPALPPSQETVTHVLSELRGGAVDVRVPQRGPKKDLLTTVERNAKEALHQHKLKRSGDLTSRSQALEELQNYLFLDEAPLRIECIDISHTQGTDVVASLVVFEDGIPKKSDYRRYTIRDAAGDGHSDDVASIAEVTRRRFRRHRDDARSVPEDTVDVFDEDAEASVQYERDPATGRSRRFAYPPQLFVVDGGAPQVAAAARVLDELGVTDVALIGLAKRLEEVWVPGEEDPVILPRTSEALFVLQRLRDEAHRFAISYHRSKRSKRMTASVLDDIKGLGEKRRTALVRAFGSLAALRRASEEDIAAVAGFGPALAHSVVEALRATSDAD